MAEPSEECKLALKAAMELIGEKCGVAFPKTKILEFYGAKVSVPAEIVETVSSNPELTRAERVEAVAASEWARGWAEGMIGLVSPGLVGKEREEAVERLSRTLAEKVV